MKFTITRTSKHNYEPPCEGCIESDYRYPNPDARDWLYEINTLEELLNFISTKGGGSVIIEPEDFWENKAHTWNIEIYDDYRE